MVQEQAKVQLDTEKIKLTKEEQTMQARFNKAKAVALQSQGSDTMAAMAAARRLKLEAFRAQKTASTMCAKDWYVI